MQHQIIIDWLQFTIQSTNNPLNVIVEILQYDIKLFEELPKGKLGYKKQLAYDNIYVLYDGNTDMGVHVILTGKGCRQYESKESLLSLIDRLNINNARLTRIDLALDDFKGDLIQFDELVDDIKKGNIVSKWKSSTEIIKRDLNGKKLGQTISVGSRASNTFLRIYDKALEQKVKGIWYRVEIEIKKSNAEEVQKIINEHTASKIMKGVLNNYMRIVQPNPNDSNKSRWKTKEYWKNIINGIEKIKLSRRKEEKNIEEIKEWIKKQVGPSLAVIHVLDKGTNNFYNEVIEESISNLKARHIKLLNKENFKDAE